MKWIYLAIAIVSEVIASSMLKPSEGFSKLLPSMVVVIGYGLAFFFLSLTLKSIPIGVSYAIWAGVGIVLITCIGWLIFGQSLDLPAAIGIGLIVLGVLILNLFSKTAAH